MRVSESATQSPFSKSLTFVFRSDCTFVEEISWKSSKTFITILYQYDSVFVPESEAS